MTSPLSLHLAQSGLRVLSDQQQFLGFCDPTT
jgi:hypothetical protein